MTEKVEIAEQTPLKSDVDPEAAVAETGDVVEAPKTEKKKIFFWQRNKKVVEGTEEKTVETKEGEVEKKKCWWSRKCTKEQQPTFGLDMINRDEKSLQTTIDLGFSDIFGEPDAVRSINGIWKVTNCVFLAVRSFFYKLITLIVAIPLAIIFGLLFAIVSALNVFVCVPVGRLLQVPAQWIFKTWNCLISNVFDPVFRSIGLCFNGITIRRYGINSEVTQPITA
uniref:Caveolin n=1 Tax=Panagrolaimus sp. JU765 TaxID=591449 RepID=A0AC34RJB6_9BILA